MTSTVSIVRCPEYEAAALDRAIAEAVELAGGFEVRGASVLLKPNLLNANGYERAVSTHPAIVAAAVRWLKRAGASRILAGDSPGWQPQDLVGHLSGVRAALESEGGEWASFSEGEEFELPVGRVVKRFKLARPLSEVDLLVSLPKLKTHDLMYYSGAIKNLFGLVPGLDKSAFHLRFPGREDFAAMLADLALVAAPDFSLMDAIMAMEGPGPNNGRPKKLGLVLASRDALALDWSAAGLIGYDPASIPYLADLAGRMGKLREGAGPATAGGNEAVATPATTRRPLPTGWMGTPADIAIAGLSIEAARPGSFELVPVIRESDFFSEKLPAWLHRIVKSFLVPRPRFKHEKCVRCSGCVRICPAAALSLKPRKSAKRKGGETRIEIDYGKCIRCYCCHEVCPEDAIDLVHRFF